MVLSVFLFFAISFLSGCATTREHVCDDCTLGIQTIKESHIPRLSADDCTWGMAKLLAGDIEVFVEQTRATWEDLGVTHEWVTARVKAAEENDKARARRELAVLRTGATHPDLFKLRLPVISGLCTFDDLGATPEEQQYIEKLALSSNG